MCKIVEFCNVLTKPKRLYNMYITAFIFEIFQKCIKLTQSAFNLDTITSSI